MSNFVSAQNFTYSPDDWYILTMPSSIISITEDNFNIYIATENGIYNYSKNSEDFQYDNSFPVQQKFPDIRHFYYDSYRDYYWVVHKTGISYKSEVSSIWREMSFVNSGIYSTYEIDDIGSSPEYFWIRSASMLYPFDPFSALPADEADAQNEIDFIQWGFSRYGIAGENLDISRYIIEGDWTIGLQNLSHKDGREMHITVFMEDQMGNQWFGTSAGYLLKGWRHSSRLELLTFGLPFNHVTVSYEDQMGNWWFGDSYFKRTGQLLSYNRLYQTSNAKPFISQWNESDNEWTYYLPNESVVIENRDINAILRVGSTMYFGTMFGLLYLDLYNRDWNLIDVTNGLNDYAVWDIIEYSGSIYVATANGINEISIVNQSIIPDKDNKFEHLSHNNIFDIEANSQYLYIASDQGLLRMDWEKWVFTVLSNKQYHKIHLEENGISGTDGTLWLVQEGKDEKFIKSNVNDFDYCGSYLWSYHGNQITLVDTVSSQTWEYDQDDGVPGNKIYGINCDSDWVWFLTNRGLAFYNWNKYHYEKN